MKKNNHNYVDVLKMDIEGAAMEVLNNILQEKIFPGQIIVEFEYSETDKINEQEFKQWSKELSNIVNKFKHNGYKCYNLPRYSHFPYSTIEILFVKNQF